MRQMFLMMGLILLLFQPLMAQTGSTRMHRKSGVERKLIELKKIVQLSPSQEQILKEAYAANQQKSDSVLYNVTDATQATLLKYQADKQLQAALMQTLTGQQKVQYLTVIGTPDVMAKADEKVQLLRESGEYTEQELAQKQKDIFYYLITEKVVYLRDKYDIAKQKDNIHRLKQTAPSSLKESESREKLKASGKIDKGEVKWQH